MNLADLFRRLSRFVPCAAGTSRTLQSRHAVMSFAENVSKNVLRLDLASVQIATSPLGIMTTCTSLSNHLRLEVASFPMIICFDSRRFLTSCIIASSSAFFLFSFSFSFTLFTLTIYYDLFLFLSCFFIMGRFMVRCSVWFLAGRGLRSWRST